MQKEGFDLSLGSGPFLGSKPILHMHFIPEWYLVGKPPQQETYVNWAICPDHTLRGKSMTSGPFG